MRTSIIIFLQIFVHYLERILSLLILARVLMSWFPAAKNNFFGRLVIDVTQPFFNLVYRIFPQMRLGVMDFSPIIIFLAIGWIAELIIFGLGKLIGQ